MTTAKAESVLGNVVSAKNKKERNQASMEKAQQRVDKAEIELQQARQEFHQLVGPYPMKWRFKGPFKEAFTQDDWLYYTFMFAVACFITWILMQLVGWAAMFALGIASVHIASRMRWRWARFTNWANTGKPGNPLGH